MSEICPVCKGKQPNMADCAACDGTGTIEQGEPTPPEETPAPVTINEVRSAEGLKELPVSDPDPEWVETAIRIKSKLTPRFGS